MKHFSIMIKLLGDTLDIGCIERQVYCNNDNRYLAIILTVIFLFVLHPTQNSDANVNSPSHQYPSKDFLEQEKALLANESEDLFKIAVFYGPCN